MKLFLVACLVAMAVGNPTSEPIVNGHNYHELVGIPLAGRIKEAEEAADSLRIGGGSPSRLGVHPYLGGLLIQLPINMSICGSSLISRNRALTAAHCWDSNALYLTVVLGSTRLFPPRVPEGTRIVTSDVRIHEDYNPYYLYNDIAMIILPFNVNYNEYIRPIALPSGEQVKNNFVGQWARVAGFGLTSAYKGIKSDLDKDPVQRHVTLQVITNAACMLTYRPVEIIPSTLCATSIVGSACDGDSGGPLSLGTGNNATLIGVTSFARVKDGCLRNVPTGYARVTSFLPWIYARM